MAVLAAAGAIVGAIGKLKAGEDAAEEGELQAIQLRANANAAAASSQRQAQDVLKRTELVKSRVTALAAASGAGATDPSVINDIANIDTEGHYQAMERLYNGSSRAQGLNFQADAAIREGNAKRTAYTLDAVSSVLSTGSDLYSKYGAGSTQSYSVAGNINDGSTIGFRRKGSYGNMSGSDISSSNTDFISGAG